MIRYLFSYFLRIGRSSVWKGVIFLFSVMLFSVTGFIYFEIQKKPDLTWLDSIWWCVVTMATVGYGDLFPVTNEARFFVAVPTMILGISILGYILSMIATVLIQSKSNQMKGMLKVKSTNHLIICNFPSTGKILEIFEEIKGNPHFKSMDVVLIDDTLEEIPPELANKGIKFVRGNPTNSETLEKANFKEATHVIVLAKNPADPHSDDTNLAILLTIEKLHSKIFSIAECVDQNNMELLKRTDCDSIICNAKFLGHIIAQELQNPGIQEVISELLDISGQHFFMARVQSQALKSYREISKWSLENGYILVGIKRGHQFHVNPAADLAICAGDMAILIGETHLKSI